jgi:hypothetical protein
MAMDDTRSVAMPQLTACPQCTAPAEIVRRTVLESTDGPIEHVAVRCAQRHHFVLPTAQLRHDVTGGGHPDGRTPDGGRSGAVAPTPPRQSTHVERW